MSGVYAATALGGNLRAVMTAAEVAELWEATEPEMRERDQAGLITLWARASDPRFERLAPLYLRPIGEAL